MIYYPLSVLMLAGIREILVISTERDVPMLQSLLGDGRQLGVTLSYVVQPRPEGIAQAFLLGADFIGNEPVSLILGDNLLFGHDLTPLLLESTRLRHGARVFAYQVQDPERYGVVEFGGAGNKAVTIEEKPKQPRSSWAVTGLYFYDANVVEYARRLRPSARGELEITDLNRMYLEAGQLAVTPLGRGFAWLDLGTFDSLLASAQFVQTIEQRQGLKIACLEEIALAQGFIDLVQFADLAERAGNNSYGHYLKHLLAEKRAASHS